MGKYFNLFLLIFWSFAIGVDLTLSLTADRSWWWVAFDAVWMVLYIYVVSDDLKRIN